MQIQGKDFYLKIWSYVGACSYLARYGMPGLEQMVSDQFKGKKSL
jgi:hypothetical protein